MLLSLITFSCKEQPTSVEVRTDPGKLSFTWLQGLGKISLSHDKGEFVKSDSIIFDLGEIRGSTNFYFMLNNVGGTSVTDIQLIIPESTFAVFPQNIDTLLPNPNFQFDRIKIVRVSATHGTPFNGTGFLPLMPKGLNVGSLMINGNTLQENFTSLALTLSTQLWVHALVMEVTFFDGTRVIDLSRPAGSVLTGGMYYGSFIYFWNISDTLKLVNSGNVPVVVLDIGEYRTTSLQVNQTLTLNYNHGGYTVSLDGLGVVSDNSLFPKLIDGKTYFSFFR